MKTKLTLLLTLLQCANANAIASLPPALQYQNKPIDTLCFFDYEQGKNVLDLKSCGLKGDKSLKITSRDEDLIKKGYYGYEYSQHIDSESSVSGMSYYKFLGQEKNAAYIYTINNSGGTGVFTGIARIERIKNSIKITPIANGDRCNGGVDDAVLNKNEIQYQRQITPFDILETVNGNIHQIKAYDDLAACAACCLGTANYKMALNADKEQFLSLDLTGINWAEANTQGKYQLCFNKTAADFLKSHTKILLANEVKELMQKFNQECVKKK